MSLILEFTQNKPNCSFGMTNDLILIGLNPIRLVDFCENVSDLIRYGHVPIGDQKKDFIEIPIATELKETILGLNLIKGFNLGNFRLEGKRLNTHHYVTQDDVIYFPVLGTTLQINLYDFYELVFYVMTNVDLTENDPRLNLIQELKDIPLVTPLNLKIREGKGNLKGRSNWFNSRERE